MSRVYKATGTVRAYFVSDESEPGRLQEIGREVINDTIEYDTDEALSVTLDRVIVFGDIPAEDCKKYVFVRSKQYEEDTDLTVEQAMKSA